MIRASRRYFCLACLGAVVAVATGSRAAAQGMDVSYVPATAVAAVIAHPQKLLASPAMRLMPIEVFSAVGKQQSGVDPLDIQQAVILIDKVRNPQAPPDVGAIVRLAKPYQQAQILPALFAEAQPVQAGGKTYLRGAAAPLNCLHMPDAQTVVLATEPMMQQMLAVTQPTGHLVTLLQRTSIDHHLMLVASLDAMRAEVNAIMAQAPALPPQFEQFKAVPEHLSAVAARVNVNEQFNFDLVLLGQSDQSAQELERLVKAALAMSKEAVLNAARQTPKDPADPVQQAMTQYTERMADYYEQMLQPQRNGRAVVVAAQADPGMSAMGVMVATLLPAVQAARDAARRMNSQNNLRQIGLAVHNYHDTHREFPTDIVDEKGNKLLSWRVRLLPFLEESALYEQFHLNEAWNSEHNLKLLAQMPAALKNPLITDPTATNYLAIKGPGTFWEDGNKKLSFRDITDGTSNTAIVVEANAEKAVPWTKPDDLQVDFNNPLTGLGDLRPTGFHVLMADGSVRMVIKTIAPATLKAIFTRAGGEVVGRDF